MSDNRKAKIVLVIEDDAVLNELMVQQLSGLGMSAFGATSWSEAAAVLETTEPDLALLDIRLPDVDGLDVVARLSEAMEVVILTAYGSIEQAVDAMKAGASEYLSKPVNLEELEIAVNRTLDNAELRKSVAFYKARQGAWRKAFLIGESDVLKRVEKLVDAVAAEPTSVLIQGESGVGKELVAREIHERSTRAEKTFVALDCCTLQENMFESELFGHEAGAFSGADTQRDGLIDSANGGTLFLDEIGELSKAMQAKLLRVVETGEYRRFGGVKDLRSDARIVAATNHDLREMTATGRFRKDLFYRLNAFVISVPPLRSRREDIPSLARHFLDNHDFSRRLEIEIAPDAEKALLSYDWPGNVRELRNVIERAIILSGQEGLITADHLGLSQPAVARGGDVTVNLSFDHEPTLEELKIAYISNLYRKYSGHRSQIADSLGISERNVYRMIKRYDLS